MAGVPKNFHTGWKKGESLAIKFERMSMPEPMSGCFIWLGDRSPDGYGRIHVRKKKFGAHCVAWELANGPIPKGLVVDHLCRLPSCVNPAHLRVITDRENILCGRGWAAKNAAKQECSKGHPYSVNAKGARFCRACANEKRRARDLAVRRSVARC